jgi:hypothetical protein
MFTFSSQIVFVVVIETFSFGSVRLKLLKFPSNQVYDFLLIGCRIRYANCSKLSKTSSERNSFSKK